MLKEFKEFALRGNVVDLAIGVIIGSAFGKIVSSLVADIIMPPIGLILGRINFKDLFIDMSGQGYASLAKAQEAGAPTINYGQFINTLIDFIIIALVLFLIIRAINRLKPPAPVAAAPAVKDCPYCLSSIPAKATRCPHCTSQLDQ